MADSLLIDNATIVNEGVIFTGSLLIEGELISRVFQHNGVPETIRKGSRVVDATGKLLLPGVIDDQVHFREPGLTHKGDIATESAAAVAGGITSYMEMPNTNPQTTSQELLEAKYLMAEGRSMANYSFYMGTTNDNLQELLKTDPATVCGIKVFMGASTGNMLVDDPDTLKAIFSQSKALIAVHCEDEETIRFNLELAKEKHNGHIPFHLHPVIRSEEACYKSSSLAVEMATKYGTRLHVLHLSTARELSLFRNDLTLAEKKITAEVCVHHLWFDERDYARLGSKIKWNPAIKSPEDKDKLLDGLLAGKIDVVATDHAPHTIEEKLNNYSHSPSGGPLVQHALPAMLEFFHQGKLTLATIVEKMCHAPATLFGINRRGYIRNGYYADLVLVDLNNPFTVKKEGLLYKCGWSPFEDVTFTSSVYQTFVNGNLAYDNGKLTGLPQGKRLLFNPKK